MNTNEIAATVALVANTLGRGIEKAEPLAKEVISQYKLRGLVTAAAWLFLCIVISIINRIQFNYNTIKMTKACTTIEHENDRFNRGACTLILLMMAVVAIIAGGYNFLDFVAPLPQMLRIR